MDGPVAQIGRRCRSLDYRLHLSAEHSMRAVFQMIDAAAKRFVGISTGGPDLAVSISDGPDEHLLSFRWAGRHLVGA